MKDGRGKKREGWHRSKKEWDGGSGKERENRWRRKECKREKGRSEKQEIKGEERVEVMVLGDRT